MKKVYQTIVDPNVGNCMQAAIASLLNLDLNEVPNFIQLPDGGWVTKFYNFLKEHGYDWQGTLYNMNYNKLRGYETTKKHRTRFCVIKNMEGVDGFFYAAVLSPKYYDKTIVKEHNKKIIRHAVIIDKNYNIIHDPNPNNKNITIYPEAKFLKYNGIIDIFMINKL